MTLRRGWLPLTLLLAACGGDDSSAVGMAEEVDGRCVLTPGSYVVTYEVLSASGICTDFEPLPDEYLTVTDSGSLVARSELPQGCVDGPPVTDGCFVGFTRYCSRETTTGSMQADIVFQTDFAEGYGISDMSASFYAGNLLLDTCQVTQESTIRRR